MRNMFTYILIVLLGFDTNGQIISLPNECKFSMGDNTAWASQAFDDSDWASHRLGTSSLTKDMEKDIYIWYRIKILIPDSMKDLARKGKGLKLSIGKIDDIDQTFFNGKLIGQTGSFPPNYQTKWNIERTYIIPENDIQWNSENLIAVRVFSPDAQGIGMYQGPYRYAPILWHDFVSIQQKITKTIKNGFKTSIDFSNNRAESFVGTIKYYIHNTASEGLFSETKPIKIEAIQGSKQVINFGNYEAHNQDILKVGYIITENNSGITIQSEQLYLANKQLEVPVLSEPMPIVKNKIEDIFVALPLQNQQQFGYLGKRMNQNLMQRLLKLDEEGTLDGYLQRPGHHAWAGEHIGKYLETACNVWKNTHNTQLKNQMDRLMYQLVNSQLSNGYLGTYTPDEYWTSWDVWSHKYNLYGLMAYYTTTGYKPALQACEKIGDLMCATFGNKTNQLDIINAGTHIGMASTSILDPMLELYRYTNNKKYLNFCYYMLDSWEQENGPKIISQLLTTQDVKKVGNGKTYEMLSVFVGLAKLYRITGDETLLKPCIIAWQSIVNTKSYITGTTSHKEHFDNDYLLPAEVTDNIGEGCVTTTWIQFNQQLLAITGEDKYVEQIEKSIYNHLLAAENPQTGCVSYYTPLMGKKPYTCNITCCQSSVPRGIAMIPYFTFGNIQNTPTLLMYEPASYKENLKTLSGKNIGFSLKVAGNFPEKTGAIISITTSETANFPLAFRVPAWSNNFSAKIGDSTYKATNDKYLTIRRRWKSGEKIIISFEMPLKVLDGGISYPNQVAFQRGPQILAFDESLNTHLSPNFQLVPNTELLHITTTLPKQWIGKQTYTVHVTTGTKKEQAIIVPFADASQTGGSIKVWLPLDMTTKK